MPIASEFIQRTAHRGGRPKRVGVDHGGLQTIVAHEGLDGADIAAALQEMGGKAVPQRVDGRVLVNPGLHHGFPERPLQGRRRHVLAHHPLGGRIALLHR